MRMNQKSVLSAYEVINTYEAEDLFRIFNDYGELTTAKKMAYAIVNERQLSPIKTSDQLKKALDKFLPKHKNHKILAQIYQAIRIEVNQEIEVLKEFLTQSLDVLKVGGRLSIISYHSLEDRLVKRYMKNGLFEGEPIKDVFGRFEVPLKPIGKLIIPTDEEIYKNNRARSAKLRIAEKL
jgi:16S rRNA (cytosine1402-N4)-methyltransferase